MMPKKLHSNPKAEAARERKDEVKKAKKSAAEKAAEDAKWVDEGSTATEQRKREKAQREAEEARKRAEKKALLEKDEAEAAAISGKAKGVSNADKMTRAMLLRQAEEAELRRKAEAERVKLEALKLVAPEEPAPNLNRAISEEMARDAAQFGAENVIYASGVDAVLSATSGKVLTTGSSAAASSSSSGPSKAFTTKSAFAEFEERMMPIVQDENPRLKLSQRKEIIFKMWQKVRRTIKHFPALSPFAFRPSPGDGGSRPSASHTAFPALLPLVSTGVWTNCDTSFCS